MKRTNGSSLAEHTKGYAGSDLSEPVKGGKELTAELRNSLNPKQLTPPTTLELEPPLQHAQQAISVLLSWLRCCKTKFLIFTMIATIVVAFFFHHVLIIG